MAVKSVTELMQSLGSVIGERTDDESIAFVEDITDTLNDFVDRTKDETDWQKKYEENDEAWRKKYRDRFYGNIEEEPEEPEPDSRQKVKTFSDLFTTK